MLSKLRRAPLSGETLGARHFRLHLVRDLTFEVIPLKSLDTAIEALPAGSRVSVTASPVKGQDATCEITERLMELGHEAIPHVSARLVPDRARVSELAGWFRSAGVSTMFLVGGDVESPGAYSDAASFLRDLLECDHGLSTIGVTAYPHGHPLIAEEVLHEALHAKQALLAEAGVEGYCSTQMCFDPDRIEGWLRGERAAGLTMPVHLGISGVDGSGQAAHHGRPPGRGAVAAVSPQEPGRHHEADDLTQLRPRPHPDGSEPVVGRPRSHRTARLPRSTR